MKNNQFKPKNNCLYLAWEKINTVIEGDLALILIIMTAGLLHTDQHGMRGFPVPWLFPSHSTHIHSSMGAFFTSLLCAAVMVAIGEILNAVLRRGSEPTAFRSHSSQTSVYANTYDDSQEFQDIPDTGAFESKDTRNYSKALQKNQKLFRKVEETINKPPVRTKYVMGHGEKIVLRIVLSIFAASIILLGAMSGLLLTNDSYEDDIASDDYDTEYTDDSSEDYGSLIGTPFFEDNEYLQSECDRIIEMLRSGDEEGLSESMAKELDALEKSLNIEKEAFLRLKKDEIIPFIEEEIAVRYYYQEAGIKIRLRYDDQLKEALTKPSAV